MVNLVIVSHSQKLAQGVKELADEMLQSDVDQWPSSAEQPKIIATGGIENHGTHSLGTNAMEIADAIRQVWSPDGVLILADLGSALLNAQMAIEMLDKEMQSCCRISNAPLVEGSIVATVEASLGRSLGEVEKAAATACTLMKNN